MTNMNWPAAGTAGQDQELADRSGPNPTTAKPPTQDSPPQSLRREQFPKLSDDQWRERRAVLRRYARERTRDCVAVTFGGSVISFYTVPRCRRRKFFLNKQAEQERTNR